MLHIIERIADAGAGFRSLTENMDTTTPSGRMMMQMIGSFAEFERAMIRERTTAGLAAARAEGRVGGRRKKLDAAKRHEIAESVHRPQVRRRHGKALQHRPADRVAHRGGAPDLARVAENGAKDLMPVARHGLALPAPEARRRSGSDGAFSCHAAALTALTVRF